MNDEPAKNIPLAPRVSPTNVPTEKPAETIKTLFQIWNITSKHSGHKDMRADVLKAIEADDKIPAHWKSAILAEIEARDGKAFEIHAHTQEVGKGFILTLRIQPLL